MSEGQLLPVIVVIATLVVMALPFPLIVLRRFRRCRPDEALIRSGSGGTRVITEGGVLGLPWLHEVRSISLRPVRISVAARGPSAVRTHDAVKVDITLELEIGVNPVSEDILTAARSFGDTPVDAESVRERAEAAALLALRRVVAAVSFAALWDERDHIHDQLVHMLEDRMQELGLRCREAAITGCAVVPMEVLDPDDPLDAESRVALLKLTGPQLERAMDIQRTIELTRARHSVEVQAATPAMEDAARKRSDP